MAKNFAAEGKRRPLLDIPISNLILDIENPRLSEKTIKTEFDVLKAMYNSFALEELAISMSENGYFDEEPIVVVPIKIDKELKKILAIVDIDKKQNSLQEYSLKSGLKFKVIEGNRRVATAKIITNSQLMTQLDADLTTPKNEAVKNDILVLPAIVYEDREDVFPYLGVRHIIGIRKWGPYPKAVYISNRIQKGEKLTRIQEQVGDTTNTIKKQYFCYKIVEIANDELGFDIKSIRSRFSLLMLAIGQPSIRNYIGVPELKSVNFNKRIIPINKLDNLKFLLNWIYGNKNKLPLFTDSRKITSRLSPILSSTKATAHLIKTENLDEAYEFSEGEETYLKTQLIEAQNRLTNALRYIYKYRNNNEIKLLVEELKEIIEQFSGKKN